MHFTERASFCYIFICSLKKYGVSLQNCILFAQYMKGAQGNRYFMWREDQETEGYLTERTAKIDSVIKMLPKYFSRVHKKKFDYWLSTSYLIKYLWDNSNSFITKSHGDQSKAPTSEQEKYDERIRCIIKNADETLARDLQINNGKKLNLINFGILQKMLLKNWLPLTIDAMHMVHCCQGKL